MTFVFYLYFNIVQILYQTKAVSFLLYKLTIQQSNLETEGLRNLETTGRRDEELDLKDKAGGL